MRKISEKVWTYIPNHRELTVSDTQSVAERNGVLVPNYADLVSKIASLAFKNPQLLLFFRGQEKDYKIGYSTTLLPAIFRDKRRDLKQRYESLRIAEQLLMNAYGFESEKKIRTHRILRWAMLQHYEISKTPLLDVTYSPRVACSFSRIDHSDEPTYIYVLGLPQISGSISVSSEHEIQNIRLLSVCPPTALRPHYQEGHLIGDYPTLGYAEKMENELHEVDFKRRLVCKFRLKPGGDFQTISEEFLFPNSTKDKVRKMAEQIIEELVQQPHARGIKKKIKIKRKKVKVKRKKVKVKRRN
ncbi:MAG: FRG domain-containing protein [Planctomycetota bacterium]|jgi:hypothetical protein